MTKQQSITELKESYQRAHRDLIEAKEALQKTINIVNTTKPQLAQAWFDENYPDLHAEVKDASGKGIEFSMGYTINVPFVKYPSEEDKKQQEKVYKKLKRYLEYVESEALIDENRPSCEGQAIGEAVVNEFAEEPGETEQEHQHHFCMLAVEGGIIRYCVTCEKSAILPQVHSSGIWRSNWQKLGEY